MANNFQQAVDEIATHFQSELEPLRDEVQRIGRSRKVRTWIFVGVAAVVLVLLISIFYRSKPLDQSAIDDRVRLRDSIIKAKAETEAVLSIEAERLRQVNADLVAEFEKLERAGKVSAGVRQNIQTRKNESINSIRAIRTRDSLRRAFIEAGQ